MTQQSGNKYCVMGSLLWRAHVSACVQGPPVRTPTSAKDCSYPISTPHGKCAASECKQPPVEIETDRLESTLFEEVLLPIPLVPSLLCLATSCTSSN